MKDNERREIDLLIAEGDEAVLSVRDNGTGIEESRRRSSSRSTPPRNRERASGLGLAISSGIVSDLGGRLTARNPDTGGAVFEIRLPLLADRADLPAADLSGGGQAAE